MRTVTTCCGISDGVARVPDFSPIMSYVTGNVYQRRGDDKPVHHMKVDFEPMCFEWARDQNRHSPPVVMLKGIAINMCGLPDSSH